MWPMSFARMAEWLAPAKLSYACSAHYLDQIDAINLSAEQQALLKDIPDPMFRETVRDFCVNQQFRRDYWVKGLRRLSMLEQGEAVRAQRVVLHTDKLNAFLINKARGSGDISYLASPVTGGGIPTGRFQQLFLLAKSQGKKQPSDWAQFAWQVLTQQGQRIVKEGKTLGIAV